MCLMRANRLPVYTSHERGAIEVEDNDLLVKTAGEFQDDERYEGSGHRIEER